MSARLEALDAIHAACWQQLSAAARERSHGWRRLALATVGVPGDGSDAEAPGLADVRTVVLREADPDRRLLVFYTDGRAAKVAQMRREPRGMLLAWCPQIGWQLRLRVRLAIDTGGLAVSARWARLKLSPAAQDYLSPLPPGTLLGDSPPAQAPLPPASHGAPDRDSRSHFAVVFATVERIDWLELHAEGHRRAIFSADGRGQWRVP